MKPSAAKCRQDERVTLSDCIFLAARTPSLVAEFDRLSGTHLSTMGTRAPLDAMIDEATGRDADALRRFVDFVYECIYIRLPLDVRADPAPTCPACGSTRYGFDGDDPVCECGRALEVES